MRKTTLKGLIRKADILFADYIKKRDGKCQMCGKKDSLQCAHIFTRGRKTTRWDINNALTLCSGCHFRSHINIMDFADFIKSRMSVNEYDELKYKSQQLSNNSKEKMELIIAGLEKLKGDK